MALLEKDSPMSISFEALLPLFVGWTIAVVTPGPNFFATMHVAASKGIKSALLTVAGITLGTLFWALAAFYGLKTAFALFPLAATAIKMVGGAFLIWTGWRMWCSASSSKSQRLAGTTGNPFRFGLITNLSNPKTAAVAASLFVIAVPAGASGTDVLLLVATILLPTIIWYSLCAFASSRQMVMNWYSRCKKSIVRVAGMLFMGFGLKLVLDR